MSTLQATNLKHNASASNNITLDSAGNVGIGTATPSDPMVVERSLAGGNGPFLRIRNSAGPNVSTFGPAVILDNGKAGVSPCILTQSQDTNAFRVAQANSPFATFMQITSGGDFQFNSGYGSVATAFGCRAWVNFNGTGTVAIRASGNVSSITDNGTGDYTVNFTAAMPDVNYSLAGMIGGTNSAYGIRDYSDATARTTSAFRIAVANTSTLIALDPVQVNIAIFR